MGASTLIRSRTAVLLAGLALSLATVHPSHAATDDGGDDVVVRSDEGQARSYQVVMSSGGDLYALVNRAYGFLPDSVLVYRSTDGGTTWSEWGAIGAAGGDNIGGRKLVLAEGTPPRLFVAYLYKPAGGSISMYVAEATPGTASATWTIHTVFAVPGLDYYMDLACDVDAFSSYYLYAVAVADDGNGRDLWFSRSADQGNTWSVPYKIAQISSGVGDYLYPKIAYGAPDRVHVAFSYGDYCDGAGCFDNALRYMYATNYAGSASDWSAIQPLTTTTDGLDSDPQALLASAFDNQVYVIYNTRGFELDCNLWYSTDAGTTWPVSQRAPIDVVGGNDMRFRQMALSTDRDKLWIAGRLDLGSGFCDVLTFAIESPTASPLSFGPVKRFSEPNPIKQVSAPSICANPANDVDYALLWSHTANVCDLNAPDKVYFDATWRDGPGYPVTESGFPVTLDAAAVSPPAVAQIGGGPEQEIVFADANNHVVALQSSGVPLPGWPVSLPGLASTSPVCVGDFRGLNEPTVVAGTADGWVGAWRPDGSPRPGFPVDLGSGLPVHVTVAPVAAPYPRSIVACTGQSVYVLNYEGDIVGTPWTLAGFIDHQAAVGDLDEDGQPEIVVAAGNRLVVLEPGQATPLVDLPLTLYAFSDAPVLADLDRDGTREILLSTVTGLLYCTDRSGGVKWSFDTGTASPISGPAPSHLLGGSDVEVAFTAAAQMHLLLSTGVEHMSYPQNATSGFVGTPIDVGVHWSSPDMVGATSTGPAWAFVNVGGVVPGWPTDLAEGTAWAPAAGDIDLDGNNELVFLTYTHVRVIDVGTPPITGITRGWPMDAHDPGRTGCLDCAGEELADIEPAETLPTTAWFAPASPNPSTGSVRFRFALPRAAGVQLELFDVRGRRVRLVERRALESGWHVVPFDGRDDAARPLPAGIYYVRLSLRGPGIERTLSRKLAVLR